MNPFCKPLTKTNADAAKLCDWLIKSGIRTQDDIDSGVQMMDFVASPAQVKTIENTELNGVPEASEVFSEAIDVLEEEEQKAFDSSSFKKSSFPYLKYVNQNTSFTVPWLLAADTTLMSRIASDITSFKEEISKDGLAAGTKEYNIKLAEKIAEYIIDPAGLAVKRTPIAEQEWTVLQVLTKSQQADCSEFSMVYYELCRIAELNPQIVHIIKNGSGDSENHFVVALRLNPNEPDNVTFVDLTKKNSFSDTPPQKWKFVPPLSVIAYYHMNLGMIPPRSIFDKGNNSEFKYAKIQYRIALSLDPNLPLLNYNMGKLYNTYGYTKLAIPYFKRAVELDPDDQKSLNELSSLTFVQQE